MRSVITGGAGFIGSHLAERLLKEGWDVVVVDNLCTGKKENLATLPVEFIEQDICDPLSIEGDVDFILHFASPASPEDYMRLGVETLATGSIGTRNVLELAREKRCPVLFASTSEVYGDPLVHPQREDYWGNVNPVGPRSVYDEAKRFSEALVMAYHRYYGVDTRIVRIFNTYGPRMRMNDGRVVPNFITQALRREPITVYGDGTQGRSFCYVSDLVEGIVRMMDVGEHYPVNLGNPEEISVLDFAYLVKGIVESESPIVFKPLPQDDPKRRRPDITRARKLLGWEPVVPLKEGLKETIEWFRREMGL